MHMLTEQFEETVAASLNIDGVIDKVSKSWGSELTFITVCDRAYLPGAYALINSAFGNQFGGTIDVCVTDPGDLQFVVPTVGVRYRELPAKDNRYHHFINRLEALMELPRGNYCYLDSDILFERPCGEIFAAIDDGVLVSTEQGNSYGPYDVWLREACRRAGVSKRLPDFPYVNAGLLGFQLPRDRKFLERLLSISRKLFHGKVPMEDAFFPQLDQDVLNLLVRERILNGDPVFSLSPKRMEIGQGGREHWKRRFPYTAQNNLRPIDMLKYMIHGASLRRPWIDAAKPGTRGILESSGILPLRRRLLGSLTPYERAWAYYSCSEGLRVRVDSWAEGLGFTAHNNCLWRTAYGL